MFIVGFFFFFVRCLLFVVACCLGVWLSVGCGYLPHADLCSLFFVDCGSLILVRCLSVSVYWCSGCAVCFVRCVLSVCCLLCVVRCV